MVRLSGVFLTGKSTIGWPGLPWPPSSDHQCHQSGSCRDKKINNNSYNSGLYRKMTQTVPIRPRPTRSLVSCHQATSVLPPGQDAGPARPPLTRGSWLTSSKADGNHKKVSREIPGEGWTHLRPSQLDGTYKQEGRNWGYRGGGLCLREGRVNILHAWLPVNRYLYLFFIFQSHDILQLR